MKNKIYYLFFVVLFVSIVQNVYADDYKTNTLIPVNTVASVETDKFDYKNFVYNSTVDAKGNATIKFETIQNNTLSKTAISINVLLFDESKKNIGFLTYCTDKDVSSDNAGFKIKANQAVPFTISVTKRYFVEGKLPKDVRYIAVRDENRYCQIGGYDNYKGLTIEEILNGPETTKKGLSFPDFSSYINMTLILVLFAIIAVVGIVLGAIKLLKTMKGKKASRPVINNDMGSVHNDENKSLIDNEANKPLDLNSFYDSKEDNSSGISIPDTETSNDQVQSIEDIFTAPSPAAAPAEAKVEESTNKVDENTNAVSIEELYNSVNDSSSDDNKKTETTDNSISDLYNSINSTDDGGNKTSIDDLYESINNDDDDNSSNDE